MNWTLVTLAELGRWTARLGMFGLLGLLAGLAYTAFTPETYEARATLQLQAEQARIPLLQQMSSPGHFGTLYQILTKPELLADSGRELGVELDADDVKLLILNNKLLQIGYRSAQRQGLEAIVDTLAFGFIQEILAPERLRLTQLMAQAQGEMGEIDGKMAAAAAAQGGTMQGTEVLLLAEKRTRLAAAIGGYARDLDLVNTAFDRSGAQALLWFAEPARLVPPCPAWARTLLGGMGGLLLGLLVGWCLRVMPGVLRRSVRDGNEAGAVTGLPLIGTLPWLGRITADQDGARVHVQGKVLRPSDYSEVGRLQQAILRGLKGPLVMVGCDGGEGASTLSLLLAEKTAASGKTVALVDMNLKNRTLSEWLRLGDGAWALPTQAKNKSSKGGWSALRPVHGQKNLLGLAAPKTMATLQALADQGGLPMLFETLRKQVDVVIVEASPLAATNRGNVDAMSVATVAGRVVLMAQAGVTRAEDLKRAADGLLLAGAPVQGVVLNQQFVRTRRQTLGRMADVLGWVMPPLARALRRAVMNARVD